MIIAKRLATKVIIGLVGISFLIQVAATSKGATGELAVDAIIEGQHIKVPFFDHVKEVPLKRRQVELEYTTNVTKLIYDLATDFFVKHKYAIRLAYPYGKKMLAINSITEAKFNNLSIEDIGTWMSAEYINDTMEMMEEFWLFDVREAKSNAESNSKMNKSKQEPKPKPKKLSRSEKKEELDEFMRRLGILLKQINKVVELSPTSFYVAWRNMTIDGVPIQKEAPFFIGHIKRNAGVLMSALEYIAKVFT